MWRSYVLEGIVVLKVWRHHAWMLLWRQRVFLDLMFAVIFLVIVVIVATLVLEVGGSFVFVWCPIL
jgi:hypothetical protein